MSAAAKRLLKRFGLLIAATTIAASALVETGSVGAATVTPILISQVPLTIDIPSHPQVLIALGNSQSMDGDLSGAIMTGSGALSPTAVATGLGNSSSPGNSPATYYTIPSGFTPPVTPAAVGTAAYTVNVSGTLEDNSASRLNVAKAGISAILSDFMEYADFGLMDYQTSYYGANPYTTWVYYMSAAGGFTFTSVAGANTVANPCDGANVSLTDAYSQSCEQLLTYYGAASGILTQPYMVIGDTSDDPSINDVLYAYTTQSAPVCMTYGGPSPASPFADPLTSYESGSVLETYSHAVNTCATQTGPTNAGFVPYSPQVMYAQRGFGYYATQAANAATTVVPMQSSGNVPTAATVSAAIAPFTSYLQPETNSTATTEIKAMAVQSPIAGLLNGAKDYFATSNPAPTNYGCTATRYVVLVTDGLPTEDASGNLWPPLGSASATGYGVTATFNGDGSLASTNDQALTDAITALQALKSAGIKTYVIGLGAGVDPASNPQAASTLTAMAVAGGTGNYFAAVSPEDLTSDMQAILAQILAANQSTASATVNTTGLNTSSFAYQPSFDTSDVNQDWTGDLKAYPVDAATGTVETGTADWSAQTKLDLQNWDTDRIIATWDPVAGAGIPFRWTGGTPAQGIGSTTLLGQELETNTADPSGEHALQYLRGDQHWQLAEAGQYRNRTHILGDIVDSAPLYVGPVAGPYQTSSYYAFEHTYSGRESVIYVGANDGMLHAFSATTGSELFAYIPNGVFSNLINLTNPYYNEQHHFYVDGSPQGSDVQFGDGSWHTVLVGGERAGGNTIYALDVTDPASIINEATLASRVLWEFSDPNMGMGFSTPTIAQTAVGASGNNLGFTVFFGNGYNSPGQTPYLYAVNPQTGVSLPGTPINLCAIVTTACDPTLPNGLSSVVVVNSLGGVSAPATTLYAGDLQGNVWRVDITDPNSANWGTSAHVTLLFQATIAGARQPITTTPLISLNPDFPRLAGTMVYVGTGQMLGIPDLSTIQTQSMYGIYDSGNNTGTLNRSNLVAQTMSADTDVTPTLRFVAGTQLALPSQNGWYVDFTLLGTGTSADLGSERIVTDPRLDGGAVVVTSVQPSWNTCLGGDVAYLNEFNYAGGAFNNPVFNYTGTGAITSALLPANGMLLGSIYASAPVFSNFGGNGAGGGVVLVTESNGTIPSFAQRGFQQQRFSWREIR